MVEYYIVLKPLKYYDVEEKMAIKTVKINKYICSDGTEFIGGHLKKEAEIYEAKYLQKHEWFKREMFFAELFDRKYVYSENENNIDHPIFATPESIIDPDVEWDERESELQGFADCMDAGSFDDFTKVANYLHNIIEEAGGIEIVKKICEKIDKGD